MMNFIVIALIHELLIIGSMFRVPASGEDFVKDKGGRTQEHQHQTNGSIKLHDCCGGRRLFQLLQFNQGLDRRQADRPVL